MTDQELMILAKQRVNARIGFNIHLTVCIVVSVMLVIIYYATSSGKYFWPIWPIIGLSVSLVPHGAAIFSFFNSGDKVKAEYDRLKQMYDGKL